MLQSVNVLYYIDFLILSSLSVLYMSVLFISFLEFIKSFLQIEALFCEVHKPENIANLCYNRREI